MQYAVKASEDLVQLLGGNARSGITDCQQHIVGHCAAFYGDARSRLGVPVGVGQQVDQHLLQSSPVALDEQGFSVPLASVASPKLLVTAIAQQLNISPAGHDLLTEIITFVRQRQILLVLGNFEHLVEASEMIVALLRQAPSLKVLVTSRIRLQLVEEWLLPVDGLSVEITRLQRS